MSTYGSTPDYDRYLDHMMEAQFAESDSFFAFCEERGYDEESDEAVEAYEEWKRADMEATLRDEEILAERIEMELREGE